MTTMIDILIALVVGVLAALGGIFIKDIKALAIFTILIAVAAFLLAVITEMPTIYLGLLGLAVSTVRIGIAGKRVVEHRIKTYRSGERLSKLEESVRTIPESTVDVMVVEHRIKTYRSGERLSKLEESVRTIPESIVDVIPAGSMRMIHQRIVNLVTLVNNAYVKGYAVEEPSWFKVVRRYLATVGPQFSADRTKILSEYEITELE